MTNISDAAITGSYDAMALIGITIDAVEKLSGSAEANQTEIENIARTLKLVQTLVQSGHDALELAQRDRGETRPVVDREKNSTLLDACDDLTQARDLFEAAWMAANGLSQREERKAMTALLHLGNNTIVAGMEKIDEFRSADEDRS
ncbi:hypothetical protein [Phyllobacterium sp. P5_D12]